MPDDKVFIDTNIMIYAYDVTAGTKHTAANALLADLWQSGLGVLSTQVLQEFFVNVVQKIQRPIDRRIARGIIRDFLKWHIVVNDGESILEAIELSERYGYSFWDAMIVEAAIKSGAAVLMTEDLQHGQVVSGVRIWNPLH